MQYSDKMYELAFKLYDQAPWRMLGDMHLYAFQSRKTGETAYCSIMGNRGEYVAMGVYIGEEGLQSLYHVSLLGDELLDSEDDTALLLNPDAVYNVRGQNCVHCNFVDKEELPDYEDQKDAVLAYMKKHKRKIRGRMNIPIFMDMIPLHNPETLEDPDRLAIMEEALETAMLMSDGKLYGKLQDLYPRIFAESVTIPCFVWEGEAWKLRTTQTPVYQEDYGMEYVPFTNEILKKRLKKLKRIGTLDAKMMPFSKPVEDKGKILAPETLFLYYDDTKTIVPPILEVHHKGISNLEVWSKILERFINESILERMQCLPQEICYRGRATYFLLHDFCEALQIDLTEEDYMPELDDMYSSMMDMDDEDEDEIIEQTGEFVKGLLKTLSKVPKSYLKNLPDEIKLLIRTLPQGVVDDKTYKAIKEYEKYL